MIQSYREKCKQTVRVLNSRGFPCALDNNAGGFRLTGAKGDRDISPRLAPKAMDTWLDGFLQAVDAMEEKRLDESLADKGIVVSGSSIGFD